jgi:hypothetical protein
MSAIGASLERRGMHLPVLPVVALVFTAVAMTIALKVIDDARQARPVTTVQEADGYWDTTATHPTGARAGMQRVLPLSAIEASSAAVRELPAGPFHANGRAHEVVFGPSAAATAFQGILADPDAWVTGVAANAPRATDYTDCIYCMQRR